MSGSPTTRDADGIDYNVDPPTLDSRSKSRGRGVDPQTPRQYQLVGGPDDDMQSNDESRISLLGIPGGAVEISGGQFNAVGGNQFHVQVNVNGSQSEGCKRCSAVLMESNRAHTDDAGGNQAVTERAESRAPICVNESASFRGEEDPRFRLPFQRSPTRSQRQVQTEAPNDIYYRCLATQKRGSPLWIPEPNKQLPVEYQRNGLLIGDIGIITDEGGFDSLFNISLPPDHQLSINSDDLPQNFTPLEIKPGHVFKSSKFKKGAFLSSGAVVFVAKDDSSGLTFESSAAEGAILTLPDGSNSEDLRNRKKLHDYLALHLEDIYRCALIDHGRMIDNGDLRVVTGIDKTASWGMATFLNPASQTKPTFQLEFRPRDQGTTAQTHSWKTTGTAVVKAGPDTREVVDLRRNEPSQQDVEYENQAVFVRTENPTLNPRVWEALLKESGLPFDGPQNDGDPGAPSDSPPSPSGASGGPSGGNSTTNEVSCRSARFANSWSCSTGSPNTLNVHPARGINEMLLQLNPTARMAITGDDVWTSVLRENDGILPCTETVCTRVLASYDICLQNDVVFLDKTKTEVLCVDRDPSTWFVSDALTTTSHHCDRQTCPPRSIDVNMQPDISSKSRPRMGLGNDNSYDCNPPLHTVQQSWVIQTDDNSKICVIEPSIGVVPTDPDVMRIHPAELDSDDLSSLRVPALKPFINLSTLKELELDIILRNPVIRHDFLFNPDLQFRPQRKRDEIEKYWNAVWEEVQTGCTCLTLDAHGNLHHPKICICSQLPSSSQYNVAEQYLAKDGKMLFSLRTPPRVPALLSELLEVMVFVIQPLSSTIVHFDHNSIRKQAKTHSADVAYLRSIFDPALIAQELQHKVFDPSGLFVRIGQTLKHHCAPMRDRAVEEMVRLAQRPVPEAFKAARACLELLELMKVDVANHQLTQLRPWLLRNTGIFEVETFKNRFGTNPSLDNTRQWLYDAQDALIKRRVSFPKPTKPLEYLKYSELTKNDRIYMSVLKGIVDLIFNIQETHPFAPVVSGGNTHENDNLNSSGVSSSLVSLPETLYLDESRLLHLSKDAINVTKVYMFILLFRQLVLLKQGHSSPSDLHHNSTKVMRNDMAWIKHEIQAIGSSCLGSGFEVDLKAGRQGVCYSLSPLTPVQQCGGNDKREGEDYTDKIQGLVKQIVRRATDIRSCSGGANGDAVFEGMLAISQRWTDTNIRTYSPLTILVHNRLRDAVFDVLVSMSPVRDAYRAANDLRRDATKGDQGNIDPYTSLLSLPRPLPITQLAGVEILTDEIQELAKQISRLALIHLNTHLPLYEKKRNFPRFQELGDSSSGNPMNLFFSPIGDIPPFSDLA